jgi:hypothetical protein
MEGGAYSTAAWAMATGALKLVGCCGAEPVKLPGRIASTRKEMAELVKVVSEAGKDHLTSCEIYTDSGEEAVFVAHGERKCLIVKGSGAVFAHLRAVCKEASLRINCEQLSWCKLKEIKKYLKDFNSYS